MKNATCYCAGPAYYRHVLNRRLLFKQTGSSSTKVKPSPIISSFLELAIKSTMQPKFVAENVVKTETQQTFVNGLLGFITLGIYTPLEARVYCSHIVSELPIDMGNSICTAH